MFRILQSIRVFLLYIFLVSEVLSNVCEQNKTFMLYHTVEKAVALSPTFPKQEAVVCA